MKGKERRFEEDVHYTPPSLRSATLCCRRLNGLGCCIHWRNGRDAEWTARPDRFIGGNQARGPPCDGGANAATSPSPGLSVIFDPTPSLLFTCATLPNILSSAVTAAHTAVTHSARNMEDSSKMQKRRERKWSSRSGMGGG